MSIEEYREVQLYKKSKISEVAKFLAGINFRNIGVKASEIVKTMFVENEPVSFDFINNNKTCRGLAEPALLDISSYYTELVSTYLEDVNTKEEIDRAVLNFYARVMSRLNKLKNDVLEKIYREKSDRKEKNFLLDTSLDFFRIKLDDRKLVWQDESSKRKSPNDQNSSKHVVVDDLRLILLYIYALPNMVKDKREKLKKMHDDISSLEVGTREYYEKTNAYWQLFKNRDYEDFNRGYEEINKPKARG